jgi:hypothetical protein
MSVTKVTGMMQTSTKGGDITSASPCVIDSDGDVFDVTGTVSFAAFTVTAGRRFTLNFDSALTMTYDATILDLPSGGANITTAAGDVAEFFATGTNTVQCVNYTKADGTAVVAAGGGALTYIASVTASSTATIDFLTSFSSTYDDYVVRYNNVIPSADSSVLYCRVALSGSADATASAYVHAVLGRSEAAGDESAASTGTTAFRAGGSGCGNASGESGSGEIWLMGVNNTALNKHAHWTWTHLNEGNVMEYFTGGGTYMNSTVAWTGCSLLFHTGSVTSGGFHLYGVKKA